LYFYGDYVLRFISIMTLLFSVHPALAGRCDAYINQASSLSGSSLVSSFKRAHACDKAIAEENFSAFINRAASAGDIDTIVALALTAIDLKAYLPVWNMLGKFKEYSVRDDVAAEIGTQCTDKTNIVSFLQGAYFGLDPIAFSQWDDALITCESDDLLKWMEGLVKAPPTSSYDEKYNTLITAYVKRKNAGALTALEEAAIASAKASGPFNNILEKMNQSVEPKDFGEDMSPENKAKLEKALVNVANAAPPEKASFVADRLFDAGATEAAASLLPRVYPDRVQEGNRLMYGVASIENCDKTAFIHWAVVTEPAKRWSIIADVEAPVRTFKPKLKCTTNGQWPVIATNEPVKFRDEIDSWSKGVKAEWESKGYEVKAKEEKTLTLD
jgi:hypothetical protein